MSGCVVVVPWNMAAMSLSLFLPLILLVAFTRLPCSEASHFRGGIIYWKPNPDSPYKVFVHLSHCRRQLTDSRSCHTFRGRTSFIAKHRPQCRYNTVISAGFDYDIEKLTSFAWFWFLLNFIWLRFIEAELTDACGKAIPDYRGLNNVPV